MGPMFHVSLKASTGTVGPVHQQCGGRVGGLAFCVTVPGGGNSWKPDASRVGRQTVT